MCLYVVVFVVMGVILIVLEIVYCMVFYLLYKWGKILIGYYYLLNNILCICWIGKVCNYYEKKYIVKKF